jgi:Tol biopolymer transport system component
MTEISRYSELEKDLSAVYASAASEDFVSKLQAQLTRKAHDQAVRKARPFYLRPAWLATSLVLLALLITFFAIGPAKVAAAFQRLLGYVPGTGLVSTDAPLRVLAEPVEQIRDGVTLTVTSALLSADSTHIDYRVFGIPRDAYPNSEAIAGCMTQEYLLLPDGTKLQRMNDYPAIPADVNDAVLVIPCLANTLPGFNLENWALPLRFVPAPDGYTVLPVEEITPTATLEQPIDATLDATVEPLANLAVTKVIDTENGYILFVSFLPGGVAGTWVQQSGVPYIRDANEQKVAYSIPLDIQNSLPPDPSGADVMAYQFNASGVTFPVTIHYRGIAISVPQPDAQASLIFDAGEAPQAGQEWQLDQSVELAGHTLTLMTVDADARGGYSFHFKTDVNVNGVGVSIEGFQPNGGGGGGGGGMTNGEINVSISYTVLPTGKLKVVFSSLSEVTEELEWTAQWSPSVTRTDIPSTPQLAPGVCANSTTVASLAPLPGTIAGKVLLGQFNSDGTSSLVLSNLDGTGQTVLPAETVRGELSGDGKKILFSSQDGFVLYDVSSGSQTVLNLGGYNPRLSNDGTKLAYVEGAAAGIDVYDIQSHTNHQVSSQAYSAVVGWSADDSKLYVALMAAGGSAWQIQSIDMQTGATQNHFIIENGSYKSLSAALSVDGNWIAYRGRDNGSVYIAKVDGSETRLLLDSPAIGTSGLVWGANGWLGVSLLNGDNSQIVILVNPDTCEVWSLPQLNGTLQGLIIE